MRLAVTGGTGLVGRFVVEAAVAAGHQVCVLSRRPPPPGFFPAPVAHLPFDLAQEPPDLSGQEGLVHAAFNHVPGRYRGGEGDDPAGFLRANLDGSLRLFAAAHDAGVRRLAFLSSRAVYGAYPPGTPLREEMEARPDTLYGRAKLEAETALNEMDRPDFRAVALRATGVYGPAGPGQRHKWTDLFDAFLRGEKIAPRVATEVHGRDLAAAILLLLGASVGAPRLVNVSDILLDRHDLLAEVARRTGRGGPLPARSDPAEVSVMVCDRLRGLGWRPGGRALLRDSLPAMLAGRA